MKRPAPKAGRFCRSASIRHGRLFYRLPLLLRPRVVQKIGGAAQIHFPARASGESAPFASDQETSLCDAGLEFRGFPERAAQNAPPRRYRYLDESEEMSLPCSSVDASFEAVFRTHYPRLASMLTRITGDRGVAEELASEVLCRLSSSPLLTQPDGNIEGWLYRTAMNLGLDALRGQNRRTKGERSAGIEARRQTVKEDPLQTVLADERQLRVRRVLARMDPIRAELLLLRHSDFSYREAAEVLGIKATSIGTLLARSMEEFEKKYLEERGSER